jgi:hypothetical protein
MYFLNVSFRRNYLTNLSSSLEFTLYHGVRIIYLFK